MKRSAIFETLVGLAVILVAAAFLVYAYGAAGRSVGKGSYDVNAVFGRIDGVAVGAEVKIAGIRIGSVKSALLDPLTYEARLALAIDKGIEIPDDSVAKVASEGILGGAHISIEPGASEDMLVAGDQIVLTQGSVDLLGLAVQMFANGGTGGGADGAVSDGAGDSDDPFAGLPPLE